MRYGRHNPEKVAELMRTLLHDESEYVRKNVAFCLGIVGLDYHPTLGVKAPERPRWLAGLLREWAAEDEERARWVSAETLGRTWGPRSAPSKRWTCFATSPRTSAKQSGGKLWLQSRR